MEDWKNDKDWMLFELMEGNLDESEAKALREEIERDEKLAAEWSALQNAIAPKPELSFPDKSKLKRKERAILPLWSLTTSRPVRVAAAVVIAFLIAYPIWKLNTPDAGTGSIVDAIEEGTIPASEGVSETQVAESEEKQSESLETEDPIPTFVDDSEDTEPIGQDDLKRFAKEESDKSERDLLKRDRPSDDLRLEMMDLPAMFASSSPSNEHIPNELTWTVERSFDLDADREAFDRKDDYSGVRPLIDKSLYALGTPFRNTVIKLDRPEDERPTLIMAYVGTKYQAMAMLELK